LKGPCGIDSFSGFDRFLAFHRSWKVHVAIGKFLVLGGGFSPVFNVRLSN
jgi:hypothetical protein